MPQLHLYVSEQAAQKIRQKAELQGISLSRYLAGVVMKELQEGWPENYFTEVVGQWKELERPSQGELEQREQL